MVTLFASGAYPGRNSTTLNKATIYPRSLDPSAPLSDANFESITERSHKPTRRTFSLIERRIPNEATSGPDPITIEQILVPESGERVLIAIIPREAFFSLLPPRSPSALPLGGPAVSQQR